MQSTINERIKKIRELLGKDQREFGASLGLKQGSYSALETTAKGISGPVLIVLELRHNVNIEFLLKNKGEPFLKKRTEPADNISVEVMEMEIRHLKQINEIQAEEITWLKSMIKAPAIKRKPIKKS